MNIFALKLEDYEKIPNVVDSAFNEVNDIFNQLLDVNSNEKCDIALHVLEAMDSTIKSQTDPKIFFVNLLADAIEKYENGLPEIQTFEKELDTLDPALSTLRVLMSQHNLKIKT